MNMAPKFLSAIDPALTAARPAALLGPEPVFATAAAFEPEPLAAIAGAGSFKGKVTAVKYPVGETDQAGFKIGDSSYSFPKGTPEPGLGRILAALERSRRCESTVSGDSSGTGVVSEFWEEAKPD